MAAATLVKRFSSGDNASPFDEPIARLLAEAGTAAVIEPHCQVLRPGQTVSEIAFVLSGSLRVFQFCYEGKEIGLYRVRNGEVCSLSLLSATTGTSFPAWAETENRVRAVMVQARTFRQWLRESDPVRNFVFAGLKVRLFGVLELLTEVAFRRT